MPDRIPFQFQCRCGKQMKGWAYSDLVIRRERDHWFAQDHTGEGHGLVSREEYLRSRRRRR